MILNALYHCESDEALEGQLDALKLYELTELLDQWPAFCAALNDSSEHSIESENKAKLRQAITDKIESKKQEQIQYFGQSLSPVLEDHLEQYHPQFPKNPKITNIHQQVSLDFGEFSEAMSPMHAACISDKISVIKELMALGGGGLDPYLTEECFVTEECFFTDMFQNEERAKVLEILLEALTEKTRENFLAALFKEYLRCFSALQRVRDLISETLEKHPFYINIFDDSVIAVNGQISQDNFRGVYVLRVSNRDLFGFYCSGLKFIIKNIQKGSFLSSKEDVEKNKKNAVKLMSLWVKDLKEILEVDQKYSWAHEDFSGNCSEILFDQKKYNDIFSLLLELIKTIYNAAPLLYKDFKEAIRESLKSPSNIINELEISKAVLQRLSGNNPVETEAFGFFLECDLFSEQDLKLIVQFYLKERNEKGVRLIQDYYPKLAHAELMKICASQSEPDSLYALRFVKDFSEYQSLPSSSLTKIQDDNTALSVSYPIDNRLFAHIHQDAALKGTYELEGYTSLRSLAYLYHYLSSCIEKTEVSHALFFDEDEKKTLSEIQKRMQTAMLFSQTFGAIANESKSSLENTGHFRVYEVVSLIIKKLLENHGALLIPGGWRGLPGFSGHAMLYDFKMMENGEWYFLIRNTGAGLELYHENIEKSNDVYYSSIKGFKLPFSFSDFQDNPEILKDFIQILVEPVILPLFISKGYDEHRVYRALMGEALRLGFEETQASVFSLQTTKAQRSGTCSYKVLMSSLLKTSLDERVYQKVRLGIKCHSIQDYYERCKANLGQVAMVHQLSFAIQNTARLLLKLQKSGVLEVKQKDSIAIALQKMEASLQLLRPASKMDLPHYQPGMDAPKRECLIAHQKHLNVIHQQVPSLAVKDLSFSADQKGVSTEPVLEFVSYSAENALATLKILLENCRHNYALGYETFVILHIDRFYFSIPFQDHCYLRLSKEEQSTTLETLAELNTLYAASVAAQDHKPFAKHSIVLERGLKIACDIMVHFFTGLENNIYPMLQFKHAHFDNSGMLFVESHCNPSVYFVSCDPNKNSSQEAFNQWLVAKKESIEYDEGITIFIHRLIEEDSDILNDLQGRVQSFLLDTSTIGSESVLLRDDLNNIKDKPLHQATYYFLKKCELLKAEPIYQKIMQDVRLFLLFQKINYERGLLVKGSMDALFQIKSASELWQAFPRKDGVRLYSNSMYGNYCAPRDIFPSMLYVSSQVYTMEKTQPAISDESIKQRLLEKRSESNIVLAQNEGETLSEKTCLLRTLSNIRLKPETQVVATIDFMKKHSARLNDTDIQNYIFLNLYFFDFLEKALKENPPLLSDLVEIIQEGFGTNIQGVTLKEPLFFFMKVALCLRKIVANLNLEDEKILELSVILNDGLRKLVDTLKTKDRTENTIAQLQKTVSFFIWNIQLGLPDNGFSSDEDALRYIEAIIFRKNYTDPDWVDPYVETEVGAAIACTVPALLKYLNDLGEKKQGFLAELAEPVLSIVGLKSQNKGGQWQVHFPLLQYVVENETFYVDLIKGSVCTDQKSCSPLPPSVYNHPLFTFFFSVKSIPSMVSNDRNTYEFSHEGQKYRFHSLLGSDPSKKEALLQREINHHGVVAWYEYIPNLTLALPLTLRHFGIHAWAKVDESGQSKELLIQDSITQETLACIDVPTLKIAKEAEGKRWYLVDTYHPFDFYVQWFQQQFHSIGHFEDLSFIEIWSCSHDELLIRLPRYDLEFKETMIEGESCYIFSKDHRYKIDLSHHPVIPGFDAAIVLVPLPAYQADRLRTLVLMPKQEFYCMDKASDNEYYRYVFDTTNKVPSRRLLKAGFVSKVEAEDPKLFYYSKQESTIGYTLSESGELISEDLTASLYLAYLYLAKRLPSLAYKILRDIIDRPVFLTAEHLEWLRRMIEELPAQIAVYTHECVIQNDALIGSPEFAAVRLLAAAMVEKQNSQAHVVSFSGRASGKLSDYMTQNERFRLGNRFYQGLLGRKTESFYGSSSAVLYPLVKDYLNLYNNIPVSMILPPEIEKSLLSVLLRDSTKNGLWLSFTSSKAILPENQNVLRKRLPLLIVEEDNKLEPLAIIFIDQSQSIQKLDGLPVDTFKVLLQNFTRLFYQKGVVFLEEKDPLYTWLVTTVGHAPLTHEIETHIRYRHRQLEQQQLALRHSRNMKVNVTDPVMYEHLHVLVKNEVHFRFKTWSLVLSKFHQHRLGSASLESDLLKWDSKRQLNYLVSSFFSFCQIAADSKHSGYAFMALKIGGHLNYLAWRQMTPEHFSSEDKLFSVLGFILKNPVILSDEICALARENPSQAFEQLMHQISIRPEQERTLLASYWSLSGQSSNVLLKPLPLVSLERPLDKASSDSLVVNNTWDFLSEYQQSFRQYCIDSTKNEVKPFFSSKHLAENALATQFWTELEKDYEAGVRENERVTVQNEAIFRFYQEKSPALNVLLQTIMRNITHEEKSLEDLASKLMKSANRAPLDESQKTEHQLEIFGLKRFALTFEDILYLYLCQDKTLFKQYTVLEDTEIQALNLQILDYLSRFTDLQHYKRLKGSLEGSLETNIEKDIRADRLKKVGELIDLQRSFLPIEEPLFLLFEYYQNKRIFPKQYGYLKSLSQKTPAGFISQSAQLIMGGGKTSLIIPMLALKMATGATLSVVEVPSALLHVNLNDLHETTYGLWKKSAHSFVFDDAVDCTVDYLKNLRDRLISIILAREYLVTTRESMQSFELKYIKLLRFSIDNELNNERLSIFNEIIAIFIEGNAILDEVDLALSVKKQLIQVVGKGDPVPGHEIKIILDLFDFIQAIDIASILGKPTAILMKNVLEGETTLSQAHWPQLVSLLILKLFSEAKSPLFEMLKRLKKDDAGHVEKLKDYILGGKLEYPFFIDDFNAVEQDMIGLYKELFSIKPESLNFLTACLRKSVDEEIGLSHDETKVGFERELSIPYIANNVPNENARHGHYLETVLHTIKIHRMKPLSKAVVLAMLDSYMQRLEKPLGPDGETSLEVVRSEFKTLTGLDLVLIDINDQAALHRFYESVRNNDRVKTYCLQHHILNNIDKNGFTARSNAQNHASQFKTLQGVTGTDWTYRCHPHGMRPDVENGLGIDGQTVDFLMRHAQKPILQTKTANTVEESISSIVKMMPEMAISKLQAWIDLGAYFKGVSNEVVADQLATYLSSDALTASRGMKKPYCFVLFFDQSNKLWALTIKDRTLIALKSTDYEYTKRTLNCEPEQWFTYYDQIHTTGTDILQASAGYALVTLGLKTIERDVLQAVMRMRNLKYNQRIIFVVPQEVQDAHPNIASGDWSVQAILEICIENQIKRLSSDHYSSVVQKLRNALRHDCLMRLLKESDISLKRKLCQVFEPVFFSKVEGSAFQQFKHITTLEDTRVVLEKMICSILEQRASLMSQAGIVLTEEAVSGFEEKLQSMMEAMLPVCLEKVIQPDNSDGLNETEVNIEKEQNTEQEQEMECDTELHSKNKVQPLHMKRWYFVDFRNWNMEPEVVGRFMDIATLETMVQTHHLVRVATDRRWEFSSDIFVSQNFRDTCESQPQKLDFYKKEILFVLMIRDEIKNTLKCLIITPEEASYFKDVLLKLHRPENRYIWIETVHKTVFHGEKPGNLIACENYRSLLEQLALANGDMDILLEALSISGKASWFFHACDSKMDFLESCILPLHKDKPNLSSMLKQKMAVIRCETEAMPTPPLVFNRIATQKRTLPIEPLLVKTKDMQPDC